ncbi:MFS transporter [Bacillaceae bacterium]
MLSVPMKKNRSQSLTELWLITIGHGLTHWYPATFYLLLPYIGRELGLSYSQIGFIITFQYIASTISNLPGGMLVDTVGRKGLLMAVSLFWVGFPYLLMNFTTNYWWLLLCVALVGIGNNLWHPTAIPTLAQRYASRKGFALSIHGMGANIGDALAPLAISWLLMTLTWREVVVVNIVPGLVMAVLILIFLRNLQTTANAKGEGKDPQRKEGITVREYFRGLPALLRNRSLILLSTSSAFRSMTQNALATFLPLYLAHEMKFSPMLVGVGVFLLQAAGFVAAPISGHLSDRVGRKKIIMGSMAMTAVILLMMAFAGQSFLFIFFIAVLGFFLYAIRPVMQAWLMETTPKEMAGTSVGVLFGVQSLGSSVSPLLGGLVADTFGLYAAFYFIAATIICANVLVFFMPKEEKAETDSPVSA